MIFYNAVYIYGEIKKYSSLFVYDLHFLPNFR